MPRLNDMFARATPSIEPRTSSLTRAITWGARRRYTCQVPAPELRTRLNRTGSASVPSAQTSTRRRSIYSCRQLEDSVQVLAASILVSRDVGFSFSTPNL